MMGDCNFIIQEICSWIIVGNVFIDFTKAPIYDLSTRSMTFYKQVTLIYDLSTRIIQTGGTDLPINDPSTMSVTFFCKQETSIYDPSTRNMTFYKQETLIYDPSTRA